jgi:fermentation-respiration switch protein FrsA (DUF1100 family)
MFQEITFPSAGLNCAGLYFKPAKTGAEKNAGIVMAHGLGATREMFGLVQIAETFCKAGFGVLLFDYRYWGASEGEPRGFLSPPRQVEDFRAALGWLSVQEAVDPERIGVWGTSLSGGHVLELAAFDPMVKCVVSQVPAVDVHANMKQNMNPEIWAGLQALIKMDRVQRVSGKPSDLMPINGPDGSMALLPGQEGLDRANRQAKMHPNVVRNITLSSLEQLNAWAPAAHIKKISPVPLLIILAMQDQLTPPDLAQEYFEMAAEPKQMLELDCEHYDVYPEENEHWAAQAISAATGWFDKHL